MSVDISGQITAIATAALAVFAIVTAAFAFLAYRKQAQEVGLLLEQNERETAKRRRAQAERIFIGAPLSAPSRPYAGNASDLPIFGAQIWVYDSRGLSIPEDLGIILPGEHRETHGRPFINAEDVLAHTILTFRDAASRNWVRLPNGDLKKQTLNTTRDSILDLLRRTGQADKEQQNIPGG